MKFITLIALVATVQVSQAIRINALPETPQDHGVPMATPRAASWSESGVMFNATRRMKALPWPAPVTNSTVMNNVNGKGDVVKFTKEDGKSAGDDADKIPQE